MISQTTEYALRSVLFLADRGGEPQTTKKIAEATKVPIGYLSKVMQSLSRGDIVNSQRGLHGGFTLTRPAENMTILEVINAVDPLQRIHSCPLGLSSHGVNLCPMHKRLDDAMAMVETAFRQSTLAELLADPNPSKSLCEFPSISKLVSDVAKKE